MNDTNIVKRLEETRYLVLKKSSLNPSKVENEKFSKKRKRRG